MKYLKLYEAWESIEYRWIIMTNDEKYYIYLDYDGPVLYDITQLTKGDIEKGFKTEKGALDGIKKIEYEVYDPITDVELKSDDMKPKKFFIGAYMVDENDDDLGI